jgi:quercetin dioxygenase-like cupin family protein
MEDKQRQTIPAWHFCLRDDTQGIPRRLAPGIASRIFPGANVMLSIVRFEPDSVGPVHSHPEEQWGVLLEGECTRIQGNEEIDMRAGDFWHTPGGTSHGIRAGKRGAMVLDIFSPPRAEYRNAGEGFGNAVLRQG